MDEPFPGPRPYTTAEKDLFRGRDEEIRDLRDLVCAYPVVLLYSQSGAGKSSLLEAGLRPVLEKRPGDFLVARIGYTAVKTGETSSSNIFVDLVIQSIFPNVPKGCSLADLLIVEGPHRRVLVIDQMEELFTLYTDRWQQRRGFFLEVAKVVEANDDLRVLLVIREEYLGQLVAYSDLLPHNLQIRYRLERLKKDAALEAIQKPLASFGVITESASIARLVDNLALIRVRAGNQVHEMTGEFVEPVHLQVACKDLWENCPKPCQTLNLPEKLDGVDAALQKFYDAAVKQTVTATQISERRIRKWFEDRLITSSGTRRVLFREDNFTDGLPNRAVDLLENKHLIRSEPRATEQTCELTHDRLIGPIRRSNEAFRSNRRMIVWPIYALLVCLGTFLIWSWSSQWFRSRKLIANQAALTADHAALRAEMRAGEDDLRYADHEASSGDTRRQKHSRDHYATALAHFKKATNQFLHLDEMSSGDELVTSIASVGARRGPFSEEARQFLEEIKKRHHWDPVTLAHIDIGLAGLDYQAGLTQECINHLAGLDTSKLTANEASRVDEIKGLALVRIGQFDDAEYAFKQGLSAAQIDDASSRYDLRLDLAVSKNSRGDYKGALATLEQMLIARNFKENENIRISDPPSLLRELGIAYAGVHRLSFAQRQFTNALSEKHIDAYDRARVQLAFVRADIEASTKPNTNQDLDRVNQALIDLRSLSSEEHPYDPVALGTAIAFKGRLHILQVKMQRQDSIDAACRSGELRCAINETEDATKLFRTSRFSWGNAFNNRTVSLIAAVQGGGQAQ